MRRPRHLPGDSDSNSGRARAECGLPFQRQEEGEELALPWSGTGNQGTLALICQSLDVCGLGRSVRGSDATRGRGASRPQGGLAILARAGPASGLSSERWFRLTAPQPRLDSTPALVSPSVCPAPGGQVLVTH